MGGGGKGTTQTTQKMEIPPEVMARYNSVNARAEKVAEQPFQPYSNNPDAFVAPLTQTQQAGIQNTNTMAGAAQPFYQNAAALTGAGAQNVNPQGLDIGQFYNPMTQAVAAPTLQALQQQQAVERSSLVNPQTARSFGGDRSGIVQANMNRQQDLATAQAMAPIYQNAFTQALGAAQQQQGVGLAAQQANANRALQAGAQFGQLGTGYQQAGLAGAQAQLAAGQTEQQTQQAGKQALYNQWQQGQAYPFQIAQFLSNIATGTGALSGNTTSGTQTGGGGFFSSDERLKENIEKVGKTNDGQNIYRYNYKGDPRTQIGLIAQEVAKDHPDAVGSHNGYLTVNYRDATDDAVRDHKATGGAEGGMDAYNINAPSAMLSPQAGLAAIKLPQMIGGGLAIQPGAINPADQGMLAPKATGYSLGSKEGAQAELATLRGADMSKSQSGQEYFDYKTKALDDFLKNYDSSSQGGLVSGPGAFARGGYADAGYVNPALAYYGPKGGQAGLGSGGPYGAMLTPAQVQMLKAAELRFPQQKSGLEQAEKIASLTSKGNELYQAWKKPTETTTTKETTPKAASSTGYTKPAQTSAAAPAPAAAPEPKGLVPGPNINVGANEAIDPEAMKAFDPSVFSTELAARGGLIVRQHHKTEGYVNAGAGPYGNSEDENNTLGSTLTAGLEKHEMMQPGKLAQVKEGPSGVQQASQALGLAKAGKNAFDFGSKMLGSLGGEGAAAATGAAEAGTAAAGAAEGAGLLGSLGTAAGTIGEGISAILPFLALSDERMKHDIEHVGKLNNGQPVYRFKYNGDNKTRMGLIAQDVEHDHPEAVKGLGGVKMVDYKKATNDAVRQHHADGERVVEEGQKEDPSFLSSLGDAASSVVGGLGKVATGVGDTLKSKDENFWVPAIAGLGSMLASPNKTFLGAVGEGLVGGTGAYQTMQKQAADQLAKRLEMSKGRFKGPSFVNGKDMYQDTIYGDWVDEAEMGRRQGEFITPGSTGAKTAPAAAATAPAAAAVVKPEAQAVDAAKKVISGEAPKIEPRPAAAPAPAAPVVAPAAVNEPEVKKEGEPVVSAAPQKAPEQKTEDVQSELEMMNEARKTPALFAGLPANRRPEFLDAEALRLEAEAKDYEKKSQIASDNSEKTRGTEERTRLENASKKFADLARDKRTEATQKKAESDQAVKAAIGLKLKGAESRVEKQVASQFELVETMNPDGSIVMKPKSKLLEGDKAVSPGAGSPTGATADAATPEAVKKLPESALKLKEKIGEDELKMSEDFKRRQVAASRVNGLLDILTKYETGKFAEQKGDIIGKLNALGIKVDPTVSANPANFEVFMKGAIKNVFDDLPGGKILLAEIAGLSKANANAGMQPAANAKILGDALAAIRYEDKYVLDYAKWRSEHPNAYSPMDTISFNNEWMKKNNLDQFKKEVERTTGYVGQKLPTNLSEAVHGQAYYLPDKKGVYFFDKNRKDAEGKLSPSFVTSDPLAGSAAQ
jgi:hypothetical protein